jgi:hypothetical protein
MKNTMSILKTFFRFTFCLLLTTGLSSMTRAQTTPRVNQYTATPFMATWTDITATADTFHYSNKNMGYGTITMPFDFPYDGTVVHAGTTIRIGASCAISLSPEDTTPVGPGLEDSEYPGLVGIFSGIMVAGSGRFTIDTDYYEIDGVSPNRVLTIQYHASHMPGTGGGGGGGTGGGAPDGGMNPTMMQVKFYETTGVIEFIYFVHNNSFEKTPGILCAIGLNGFSTPYFVSNVYDSNLTATPSTDIRWTPGSASVWETAPAARIVVGIPYPNPLTNTAQIPMTLPTSCTLHIEVRDASGALMKTNFRATMSAGDHTITLDTEDLPSGTYFCTITFDGMQETRQMTIIR